MDADKLSADTMSALFDAACPPLRARGVIFSKVASTPPKGAFPVKPIPSALFALALAGSTLGAPVLIEPRAYVAGSPNEVGRGLWSFRDAAYATQSGSVVRYQRGAVSVEKTDSVYTGTMTETPMYVAKDSLHGFMVGHDSVCAIDWTAKPARSGPCLAIGPFAHGGITGGLALGRYLEACSGTKMYAIDTQGDFLHILDSATAPGLGLRCQIEGELLHSVEPSATGYVHESRMVNDFDFTEPRDIDSSTRRDLFFVSGQRAGLLTLDSTGVLTRLLWGSFQHGGAVPELSALKGRYKTASQSDSTIAISSDSSIYVVRWGYTAAPFLVGKISFEAPLRGEPVVAVDGRFVWVRTPTGLLSLVVQEKEAASIGARKGSSSFGFRSGGDVLWFDPASDGIARVVGPDGRLEAAIPLRAGVPTRWTAPSRGVRLVKVGDWTISVIIP